MQVKEIVFPEPLLEQVAKHAVTMDDYSDAQCYYKKRIGKDQQLLEVDAVQYLTWNDEIKFKANVSDSRSFDLIDLLELDDNLGLENLFTMEPSSVPTAIPVNTEEEEESYYLEWLFKERMDIWEEDEESYYLEWLFEEKNDLFNEEQLDPVEIEQVVVRKKRNMLYDIFKKDNNSGKRKLSPEEETVQKFRRMTISNDTSPVLKPADLKSKFRTRRCSSLDKKRLKELAEDKKKGVKQPLITQLFKGELINSEEEN